MSIATVAAAALLGAAGCRAGGPASSTSGDFRTARLTVSGLCLVEGSSLDEALLAGPGARDVRRAPEEASGPKNPMVALLLSAVLPGWGEMYAGHAARGRAFMATEAAIWIAYAGFTIQEGLREDDYKEYASVFAGVPLGSGSGTYQDIADYVRSEGYDSYNEAVREEARSLYPDDPVAQDAYFAEHGRFGDSSWEWESDARFRHYRTLRELAGDASRKAFYMTGLAVLNRAASAIDSAWMARLHNQEGGGVRASLSVAPDLSGGEVGARASLEIVF